MLQVGAGRVQVRSQPHSGKTAIPDRTAWIEPDLLYPLVKGAGDFDACYLRLSDPMYSGTRLFAVVPNIGISKADYDASAQRVNSPGLAGTKRWFGAFRDKLEARSTFRRQMKGAPFHAVYNVGAYTFQKWKVIWPEQVSAFRAAVTGSAMVPGMGQRPYSQLQSN